MTGPNAAHRRLVGLLRAQSIVTGDLRLKSGKPTSWFIDAKQTLCRSDGLLAVAELALDVIPPYAAAVGGLTVGADPVAYGVAAVAATRGRDLRSFTVRKETKGHGAGGRIAGALLPGDKVVITEDVVTRGSSPLEAARVVRDHGADVVMILAVVDRGGVCADRAAAEGIGFCALVTAPDLGFGYELAGA